MYLHMHVDKKGKLVASKHPEVVECTCWVIKGRENGEKFTEHFTAIYM